MIDLQHIFNNLLSMYYSVFPNTEKLPVHVIMSDDLNQTYAELRPDIAAEILSMHSQADYNGRMIPPTDIDGQFYIVLNSKKVYEYTYDKSLTWVGTFAHEYTHAIDYYQMAKFERLDSYSSLENDSHYMLFNYWSEYHARKHGYTFLRAFFYAKESKSQDDQICFILNTEAPLHTERFKKEYSTASPNEKLYLSMQYLGRFSVWIDLFPNLFSENKILEYFPGTYWMKNLLSFLRQHESLEQIYNHFNELKDVLSENWIL